MKKSKIIAFLLILVFCTHILCGCYGGKNIEDLAYVIALGIDKGHSDNLLQYTFQVAKPTEFASKSDNAVAVTDGGSEKIPNLAQSSALINVTIESPSLYEAVEILNTSIAKQPIFSHIKLIVFSCELAKSGIDHIVHSLVSSKDFHPNIYMAISMEQTYEYLAAINPPLISNPAKYYEYLFEQNYSPLSPVAYLNEFYITSQLRGITPVAPIVSKEGSSTPQTNYSTHGIVENKMTAADRYKTSQFRVQNLGIGIFNNENKLAYIGDASSSVYYHMLTGKIKEASLSFYQNPDSNSTSVVKYRQKRKPKISVDIANNVPIIDIKVSLQGNFITTYANNNYYDDPKSVEQHIENLLNASLKDFLVKTSQTYQSDIIGFGKYAKKNFLFIDEWEKINWSECYKNAIFNVNVDLELKRPGRTI